jgi:flagellar basal-body rod protein FlgF
VRADGTVAPATIGVFNVPGARKQGDNLFTGTAAGRAAGTVRQGALESSGVDPTRTMVEMIGSLRAFESGQKAIQTIDETLQRSSNQVGTLGGG